MLTLSFDKEIPMPKLSGLRLDRKVSIFLSKIVDDLVLTGLTHERTPVIEKIEAT